MQLAASPPTLPHGAVVSLPRTMVMRNTSPLGSLGSMVTGGGVSSGGGAATSAVSSSLLAMPITERERIYLKCRVCLCDIHEHNNPNVNIFSKDFLDEKIRRYLYVNIDFADKYPKRICQICLIKLDDIHGFACHAQKNQQILARFRENQREAEAEAAALAAVAAAATKAAVAANKAASSQKSPNAKKPRVTISLKAAKNSTASNRNTAAATMSATTTSNKAASTHKKPILSNKDITIYAYEDLKLGQFIKDPDLLTLILKALKWDALREDKNAQLDRLRKANFQDVLCNPDLLQDEDLMQLLGPYMNREPTLSITRQSANNMNGAGLGVMDGLRQLNEDKNVTEMEVGVDPELFFPDDDDETRSAEEVSAVSLHLLRDDVKPILCMDCPQVFTNQADLFEHNKLKHDTSVRLVGKKKRVDRSRKKVKMSPPPLNLTIAKVVKVKVPPQQVVIPVIELRDDDDVDEPIDLVSDVEFVPSPGPIVVDEILDRSPSPIKSEEVLSDEPHDSENAEPAMVHIKTEPPIVVTKKSAIAIVETPNTRRRFSNRRHMAGGDQSPVVRSRTRARSTPQRFACHHCGRKMSTKGNLKVHLETHKPRGKLTCEKCGRVFKTLLNLTRHKKYHSGEKFACPHCSRVYPTNSTLRAHIVTHSNVRPYECPMCFKTFKRNQDLKFHINQHTGDKPYKCPFCPKAFASSSNCFSHRKRMHADMV